MARVIILGSSNAVATEGHENTHLVIVAKEKTILIDCVGSPIPRLERAGVDFHALTDMFISHFHPDHVSGAPLLLLDLWLLGRRDPLTIHGLGHTLDRLERLMRDFGWEDWPDFYPVAFHRLPEVERAPVLDCAEFRLLSSPVRHWIPTAGFRLEMRNSARALAYSCDTEPCAEVARLASGADILIHEANGMGHGHSSAEQAGEIANRAEAGHLVLIHYPTGPLVTGDIVEEAKRKFPGRVTLATDLMEFEIS